MMEYRATYEAQGYVRDQDAKLIPWPMIYETDPGPSMEAVIRGNASLAEGRGRVIQWEVREFSPWRDWAEGGTENIPAVENA